MNYKNLGFKWGNGKFVERSKTEQEGFEKIVYQDKETKKDKVTYHKYIDSVSGVITSVKEHKTTFGTFLRVNVKTDKEELTSIQVPLDDNYGYTRECRAFLSALRGYELGEEVIITPYIKTFEKRNGKEGKDVSFFINYKERVGTDGKMETTGYISHDEIPSLEEEVKRGKTTYNADKRDDFFYEVFKTIEENFTKYWDKIKSENTNSSSEEGTITNINSKENVTSSKVVLAPNPEFDEDDLPF